MRNPMWFVEAKLNKVKNGERALERELARSVRSVSDNVGLEVYGRGLQARPSPFDPGDYRDKGTFTRPTSHAAATASSNLPALYTAAVA